jgi:integrase
MSEERIKVWLMSPPKNRPYYRLEWLDPDTGKRLSESTKTSDKTEAETKRRNREYELNHDMYERSPKTKWATFRQRYLDECLINRRENTQKKAHSVFDRFEDAVSPQTMKDITKSRIAAYVRKLREGDDNHAPAEPATIHGHLAYLKAAFKWAVEADMLNEVPHIDMPTLPKKKKIRKIVAEEYERLLMKATTEPWKVFLSVAWFTGMRRNEILDLTWDNEEKIRLDLDHKGADGMPEPRVHIPAACQKNGENSWIPIHSDLLTILLEWRQKVIDAGRQPTGYLFPFHYLPQQVSRKFTAIAKSAGLTISLHDLRRSFASRYAAVLSAAHLQRIMRHADIKTTLEYYTDVDDGLHAAIAKL